MNRVVADVSPRILREGQGTVDPAENPGPVYLALNLPALSIGSVIKS